MCDGDYIPSPPENRTVNEDVKYSKALLIGIWSLCGIAFILLLINSI